MIKGENLRENVGCYDKEGECPGKCPDPRPLYLVSLN